MNMNPIQLTSDDGTKRAAVEVPEPDNKQSALAVAFVKSGSVMLDGILDRLCTWGRRPYVRLETQLFDQGFQVRQFDRAIGTVLRKTGHVHGVFRTYLDCFGSPVAADMMRIVLVRDPRDVIVSYYYSMRYSHSVPDMGDMKNYFERERAASAMDDLQSAIQSGRYDHVFHNLIRIEAFSRTPGAIVYRYEDIIFSKAPWMRDIASRLGVTLSDPQLDALMQEFDVIPDSEKVDQHIRRVTPGDFREKLSAEALRFVERKHGELIQRLGYKLETA